MKEIAIIVIVCFMMMSCASNSRDIKASYVSTMPYEGLSCKQLEEEYRAVTAKINELSFQQDRVAARDSIGMGIGLILFWPALFLLAGSKGAPEELARLKGERDAIEVAARHNGCPFRHIIRSVIEIENERLLQEKEIQTKKMMEREIDR